MLNKNFLIIFFVGVSLSLQADHDTQVNSSNNHFQNVLNVNFGLTPEMLEQLSGVFGGYVNSAKSGAQSITTGTCSLLGGCYEWLINNKIRTSFYALLMTYGYVNYQLMVLRCRLTNKELWSLWNSAVTFDVLITMSQRELGYALVNEVQRRYTSCDQPEDFFSPLMQFLKNVDQEQQVLKHYLSLCWWIKRSCCAQIMWYNEEFYEQCQDRLRRLLYLKTVFVSWVTEYKMVRNAFAQASI